MWFNVMERFGVVDVEIFVEFFYRFYGYEEFLFVFNQCIDCEWVCRCFCERIVIDFMLFGGVSIGKWSVWFMCGGGGE